jgi:hypothetical protein
MSKWSIQAVVSSEALGRRRKFLTHCRLVRALGHILVCTLLCCIWSVCSFAEIHQVQAVPLLDPNLLRQFICNIANDTVQVTLDCARDIVSDTAKERADRSRSR